MLLPLPLSPTSAVTWPAGATSEKLENTATSGREGYANVTPFNSTAPWTTPLGRAPSGLLASIRDGLSITAQWPWLMVNIRATLQGAQVRLAC